MKRPLLIFLASLSLMAIDQLSKYIVRHGGGFYICNPNIAFGIHILPAIFWIFWVTIIVAVGWRLFRGPESHLAERIGLVLILAGALANIIDRLVLGCVIDFIDLKACLPAGMVWPVFNLADVFIISGALVLLVKRGKIW